MNDGQPAAAGQRTGTDVALVEFGKQLTAKPMLERISKLLPGTAEFDANRFASIALNLVRNTPDLLNCDRDSLFLALYDAAQSGLPPDGVLGQCYIIPFKGQAMFILGYRGMVTLALNSGMVKELSASEVRARDFFEVIEGTAASIVHRPNYMVSSGDRGPIVAFYAVARMTNGGTAFEVMAKDEVDTIRERAPGKNSPAWRDNYGEMGKKTVCRRLSKWLPQSVQRYTQAEEHFEARGEVVNLDQSGYSEVQQPALAKPVEPAKPAETKPNGEAAPAAGGRKASAGAAAAAGVKSDPKAPTEQAKPATAAAAAPAATQAAPAEDRGQLAQGTEHRSEDGKVSKVSGEGEIIEGAAVDLTPITIEKVGRSIDLQGWLAKAEARLATMKSVGDVQTLRTNCQAIITNLAAFDEDVGNEAVKLFADREAAIARVPFD